MKRYSFFAIVIFGAILFTSKTNALGFDTVTEVEKSKEKAEDGTEVLSMSIKTDGGTEIKATAKPGRLAFRISGALTPKHHIWLFRIINKEQKKTLTAAEEELDKAIEEFLEFSGSFAKPFSVSLNDIRGLMKYEIIDPKFLFMGEEDPDRKIKVKLSLIDAEGKVFHEEEKITSDQRIEAKEFYGSFVSGGHVAVMSSINSPSFKIDKEDRKKMVQFEIVFTEENKE